MDKIQHMMNVDKCKDIILKKIENLKPKMAIILGSGLSGLTEQMKKKVTINYSDLPGFPELQAEGHIGEIVAGKLNGVDVIAFRGRKHSYETAMTYPLKNMIRTIKAIGVEILFLSNAAGSLREHARPTELMAIDDHINFMGFNPLAGPNDDDFGGRFVTMTNAWDKELTQKLKDTAKEHDITLHEGVYMALLGPTFETPAEIRMAQNMGADAVGMSSVPDCIIARHCGLKVMGCSCITNMGAGLSDEVIGHDHTLENAGKGAVNFEKLLFEFVKKI